MSNGYSPVPNAYAPNAANSAAPSWNVLPTPSNQTQLPYGSDSTAYAAAPAGTNTSGGTAPTGTMQQLSSPAANTITNNPAISAAQQAYINAGMGSAWIPTSTNSYANSQPTPMPTRLQMLANYGYPVSPSMYSVTTGSNMPTNNLANAFSTGFGGGMLPSMQTMNTMSPSELDAYRGYAEGVVGVPWADLTNYIASGTASLGKAADARGQFN